MRGRGVMLVAGMRMGQRRGAEAAQAQQQQQAQNQAAPAASTAAPTAPAPQKDTVAEIQKLADLHKAGAINDQEFAAAKQKLLT